MEHLSEQELDRLSDLLLSTDDQNTQLAFEMMQGQPFSERFITELFVVCKLSDNEEFKQRAAVELERLDSNMQKVLKLKQKLSREGKNGSGANEKTIAKNINYYVVVSKDKLDGIQLAKALVRKYGHGFQYLLDNLKGDALVDYLATFKQGNRFDFSNKGITKIPKEVFQIPGIEAIEELDVSGNKIATLPHQIGQLTRLQRLNLSSNNLKKVHKNIQQCKDLVWLDLSRNNFKEFPEEICACSQLEELHLLYAASYFSEDFMLPESLPQLQNLRVLHFYRDRKEHATNLYEILPLCTSLEELYLSEYVETEGQVQRLRAQLPQCDISMGKSLSQLNRN